MKLLKYSIPGWTKEFTDKQALIDELRSHICQSCLLGYYDSDPDDDWKLYDLVDVIYEGKTYECRDIPTLLETPCGLEYGVEEDEIE